MKRFSILFLIASSTASCIGKKEGSKITSDTTSVVGKLNWDSIARASIDTNAKHQTNYILTSRGQLERAENIIIDNCKFLSVKQGEDTVFLSTKDIKFETPEGFKVGTQYSDLPKKLVKDLVRESGWGYYCKLTSGWSLAFCEGSSCTDKKPQGSSQVKWIFKRK